MKPKRSVFVVSVCLFLMVGFSGQVGAAETLYRDFWEKHVAQGMKWFTEGDEDTQVKYIGEVKDGVPHGQGVETFKGDNYRYEGEYSNGLKHGQGSMTYSDGSKYVGEFKDNDLLNGTKYDKDGNVIATRSDGELTEK